MGSFIASKKKLWYGLELQEWYTDADSVPKWWNEEVHVLKQVRFLSGGYAYVKYCTQCSRDLPDSGCEHNIQ